MRSRLGLALCALFLVLFWLVSPILSYNNGTSENMSVVVLREPFLDGERLVYRWSGDVVRSCDVILSRTIVDSEGVVTRLLSRDLGALPRSDLGEASYEISVIVPSQIAEGPAVYLVQEIPQCSWLQRLRPVAVPYPEVHFRVSREPT